ncbi:MAG: UbiD family decarboxylase, partial [Candidatus Hodarchaeales archaeon]
MGLREYIDRIDKHVIDKEVSKNLEAAGILKAVEPKPVLFTNVKESEFRIAGNLFCTKDSVADYLGIATSQLIPTMINAI